MLVWVGRFLTNNHFCRKQPFRSWLTFLYFKCFLIATLHIFVGCPLHKLLTLKVLYLLDQALSFILSRWPDQCILLFWKYSLMRFMLSLIFISSLVETLSQIYHCSSIWLFLHHSFLAWCLFFFNFLFLFGAFNTMHWTYSVHFCPAGNCMFKVNNRNTRTRCEIYSKLRVKTTMVSLLLALKIFHTITVF